MKTFKLITYLFFTITVISFYGCDYGAQASILNQTGDTITINVSKPGLDENGDLGIDPAWIIIEEDKTKGIYQYNLCNNDEGIVAYGVNYLDEYDIRFDTLTIHTYNDTIKLVGKISIWQKFILLPKSKYFWRYTIK
jgi:hypothetical protein